VAIGNGRYEKEEGKRIKEEGKKEKR